MVSNFISRLSFKKKRLWELSFYIGLTGLILFLAFKALPHSIPVSGGCSDNNSPYMLEYYGDGREISFCEQGDLDFKKIETSFFQSNTTISFLYSGYTQNARIYIGLEAPDGKLMKLDLPDAGESWKHYRLSVPDHFQGSQVRLIAVDQADDGFSWVGLGRLQLDKFGFSAKGFLGIFALILFIHFVLVIGLNSFLSNFSQSVGIPLFFLSLGAIGIGSFWLNYVSHIWGYILSISLLVLLLFLIYRNIRYKRYASFIESNKLVFPVSSFALFILLIGLYPYYAFDWVVPANRWLSLPIDNWLPKIFADQIWSGQVLIPMTGDWLSSDRPPLQVGLVLLFYPIFGESNVVYQVLSTVFQSMVLLPISILLKRINNPKFVLWGLIGICFSSLMAVHTLFVWPKLLSLSFLLIGYYFLFFQEIFADKIKRFRFVFIGFSFALAMLSHGGAVFAIVAIMLVYLVLRNRTNIFMMRILEAGWIFMSFVTFYFPWLLYQKLIDPPGDRLVKWHLAGMIDVNNLNLFEAFNKAYENMTLTQFIDVKLQNLKVIFGGSGDFLVRFFQWKSVLSDSFFWTFYSFWWFSPVFAFTVWIVFSTFQKKFYMPNELLVMLVTGLITLFLWALLMFVPGSTTIHQGTFFSWMILFAFSLALVWQSSRVMFFILLGLNFLIFIKEYLVFSSMGISYYFVALFGITILLSSFVIFSRSDLLASNYSRAR